MIHEIRTGLYRIGIRLVGNPLKELNSYIITTPERNLLIDTGFNQPECLEDLCAGIRELGLDMEKTDIFVTHLHADHCGLISQIASPASMVYMSSIDKLLFEANLKNPEKSWKAYDALYLTEGYPPEEYAKTIKTNAARTLGARDAVPIHGLEDGQAIQLGDIRLQCIHTPGHTPGHMCLYNEAAQAMFLGDHVLFDITPNITVWPGLSNPLGQYLESLRAIKKYDVKLPLPGHRKSSDDLQGRVDELLEHHQLRLQEVVEIVAKTPGISGYHVAAQMKWSIRAKNWEDFPPGQKWFAVGEALAHLEYLVDCGQVLRICEQGAAGYVIRK